jgi:hypothetical protein
LALSDITRVTQHWAASEVQALTDNATNFHSSVPLDRLLGASFVQPWDLGAAFRCYSVLVDTIIEERHSFMAALVVPLTTADQLSVPGPEIDSISAEVSPYEPPSLYLFKREFFQLVNRFEEYRRPLRQEILEPLSGTVHAFYTCYRAEIAQERAWEYSRAVWFKHFPN